VVPELQTELKRSGPDDDRQVGERTNVSALKSQISSDGGLLPAWPVKSLQRQASPGVDGVTWQEYETGLEDRIRDLHRRIHQGAYRVGNAFGSGYIAAQRHALRTIALLPGADLTAVLVSYSGGCGLD
jgi:hypothetical protein